MSKINKLKYKNGQLILGDAFKVLKELKKKKILVDAVITDPPYNISRKNNFHTIGRKGIDFGDWDKHFDQLNWIEDAISLLKNGGSIIIFNDWKNMGLIAKKIEELGCQVKDLIRWIKYNPMPRNINRRYVSDFEFGIWATKNKGWVFNKPKKIKYLRPEYKTSTVAGKEKTIHPTQKSLKLMKGILLTHTNKGDLVLDPFVGSGTTIIACEKTKRKWIAIENKKRYFNLAQKRINSLD